MPAPVEVSDRDVRWMTAAGTFAGSLLERRYRLRPYQIDLIENYRSAAFGIAWSAPDRSD